MPIRLKFLLKKVVPSIIFLSVLFLGVFSFSGKAFAVYVSGHYRSNGTYVSPYYRTSPDRNPYNNYSFPGNYNPNNGKITGGSIDSYLNSYYKNSSSGYYLPSYYSTPIYSNPIIPSCPANSYDNGLGSCKCNYGYVVDGGSCVSGNSYCSNKYGYGSSYESSSNSCKCDSGYVLDSTGQCNYKKSLTTSTTYNTTPASASVPVPVINSNTGSSKSRVTVKSQMFDCAAVGIISSKIYYPKGNLHLKDVVGDYKSAEIPLKLFCFKNENEALIEGYKKTSTW